ncbi:MULTISPECIES: PH domain-containing protein [Weeksella]|uniref:Uncharacterized protein YyaB-like PH domain-containing protein n=1 Tax=Weeksella virosa (strain ATCC 43766 / DSM 16922 / JCM 21250 / CCUG 30538 / CDC 9751 / IAM 14551 / NBRC 16016 / NCTC 11634 / CL345/78) TaxID=865938 RepID=F0P089_WEEVC|nr:MULTISPECIES: PH domain-containing protein [Weeksella]ADX68449.1 protein of unknown function DUF1200 [Weeksella virosa DSM 16922]MDK7375497.1 PH domain-containing protein [Weeksella virosa]MDK7674586.1 PH domain-containing protein [Weeksella virosa]OFM84285.1 hypothetical protein HMPREF2660_08805 [Weeksella sp. HMSC059D05]SUP54783.1 Protein of uncharacterised function (DUF1200) [Weeksella virosa]
MKIYHSKLSPAILFLIVLVFAISIFAAMNSHASVLSISFGVVLPIILIFVVLTTITYTVKEGELQVRVAGFLYRRIPVRTIRKIEKTRTILSAPAASLDRIILYYNRWDEIVLSPKDKEQFIADLQEENPSIEVNL